MSMLLTQRGDLVTDVPLSCGGQVKGELVNTTASGAEEEL